MYRLHALDLTPEEEDMSLAELDSMLDVPCNAKSHSKGESDSDSGSEGESDSDSDSEGG